MGDSTSTANGDGFDSRAESDKIFSIILLKVLKMFNHIAESNTIFGAAYLGTKEKYFHARMRKKTAAAAIMNVEINLRYLI